MTKGTTLDLARTRAAILQAATPLLYQRRLDGIGVTELCERIGVSKEPLYRHFGTKDGSSRPCRRQVASYFPTGSPRPSQRLETPPPTDRPRSSKPRDSGMTNRHADAGRD
ncbi:TetR/AcrR family transcriptional regulator [Nonomuraea maritima]|uniref:TetR/AcrR family transcriptional regulator n=1 Tax=Nonomuraea maritima TaxID=683260 RepID=UPI001FE0B2D7|nr:TetR/AcrR family transcriptional regulator [Nonomuraea maritima]